MVVNEGKEREEEQEEEGGVNLSVGEDQGIREPADRQPAIVTPKYSTRPSEVTFSVSNVCSFFHFLCWSCWRRSGCCRALFYVCLAHH